jgi:predicted CoA-binding protein
MTSQFRNPPADVIRDVLERVRNIAVVGLSPKASRPSHQVASALQGFGYRVIPVRPGVTDVLGETAYRDLYQIKERIDLVDVFRAPQHVDGIVDACIDLKLPALWLQDGVINEPAALRAAQAGITVIMDRCIYRDYLQLVNRP